MKNALLIPYTFVLMNWAAVVGFYLFARRGNTIGQDIWKMPFHSHNHPAPHYSREGAQVWELVRQ